MAKKQERAECQVPRCQKLVRRRGVCAQHAAENYFAGCSVEGCTEEVFAKARCQVHYMRLYRKKHGESSPAAEAPIRGYGQEMFAVFTRIPKSAADVLMKAAGRPDGLYGKANEILVAWAEKHAA